MRRPTNEGVYPKGRVCKDSRCDTRISIYNGHDRCWLHVPKAKRLEDELSHVVLLHQFARAPERIAA